MLIFYFFAAVQVFLSYKSFRGGISYLNYFKSELAKPVSDFTPFASIIAPCRGLDEDLAENLAALFVQDFPHYEIVFVTDDENDASIAVIEKLISANLPARRAKLVIAGKAIDSSQKIHNLRRAVLEVSGESLALVFVDSDARPGENWLRNLIAPLQDETVGAATGYRWFVQKRGGLATHFRAAWNASVASALGANLKSNFCWGGAMAMRRETFEKLGIGEKWRGALSDDFVVTRAVKEAGLAIYFVPQALTASVEDCTAGGLLEFTTRQMKITRVYAPHLWKASFVGSFLFNLVMISGMFIVLLSPVNSLPFWFELSSLGFIFVFSTGKAWVRLNAVKLVLKQYEPELSRQFLPQTLLWILAPVLFLYNSLCALFSRKILWRGIHYRLHSTNSTEILKN